MPFAIFHSCGYSVDMAQKTDLYTILYSYSRKTGSPVINADDFTDFLERYAKQVCAEKPEWNRWTVSTSLKMWQEMSALEEDGTVIVSDRGSKPKIFLPNYYIALVKEAYGNADYDISFPFPDEETLKIKIPDDQCVNLGVQDLADFLNQEEKSKPIVRLLFPSGNGMAILLTAWLPRKVLEICLSKVRSYLAKQGNRDYIYHKLTSQFAGKEELLKDFINQIMTRPTDCISDMSEGREISFYFWAFFGSLIKKELEHADPASEEQSILQAVAILEVLNGFFKTKAARTKETEAAFKNLESALDKPPYYFSHETIEKFTNSRGISLLGQYGPDGLDTYLRKHTTEAEPDELPDLLYLHTGEQPSPLIKKDRLLTLFTKLLGDVRPLVIEAIVNRWKAVLLNWSREDSMDDDKEFEKMIEHYIKEYSPLLASLIRDRRLSLVFEEIKRKEKKISDASRFFDGSKLLPLRVLLFIKQKDLLGEIRLLLPFWYSLPVISSIIAFFQNLGTKQKKRPIPDQQEETPRQKRASDDMKRRLYTSAMAVEASLIPEGATLDSYLERLAPRWGQKLKKQDLNNLVEDVQSLVRDKLRHMLRFQKISTVKSDTLDMMARSIVQTSHQLHTISDQESLVLYIKLYLIKLLTGKAAF